jgi:hypothetical protein
MANTLGYLNALESRFSSQWGNTTPVAYDNVPFIVPDESWVKFEVFDGTIDRASLGPSYLERSIGTVFITVYAPKSEGSGTARSLVDSVVNIFRNYQVNTGSGILTMFEAKVKRLGETYSAASGSSISNTVATTQWYSMAVSIAFMFDERV